MTEIPDNSKLEGARFAMPITDEEIMAYADGLLPPARRPAVRAALAADPVLMEKLESYLFTRGPFARAYDAVLSAPIPDRLLDALEKPAPAPVRPRLRDILNPRKRGQVPTGFHFANLALGSACAMLLGAWLGGYAARNGIVSFDPYEFTNLTEQGLVAMPGLRQALEQTAKGQTVQLSRRLAVGMVATGRNKNGEWCREFDLVIGGDTRGRGLACRMSGAGWRIEAAHVSPKTYRPAGKGAPEQADKHSKPAPPPDEIVEAAKRRVGFATPISDVDEKGLLGRGWQDKP